MRRLSSEESRSSGTGEAAHAGGAGRAISIRSSRSTSERSPQKDLGADYSRDSISRISRAQDLLTKLHREEKIRDATFAMLNDIYEQGQQHKHHGNILNQIKSERSDALHKKKVKAQYEAASREIERIQDQLRELGVDEDDELSSGDEEGPSAGPSVFMGEEYLDEEKTGGAFAGFLTSSAASSSVDLVGYGPGAGTSREDHSESFLSAGTVSNAPSMTPENAVHYIILVLEALDPKSSEAQVAVEKLSELIATVPLAKHELRAQAPWNKAANIVRPFLLDKEPLTLGLGLRLLRLLLVDVNALRHFKSALLLDILLVQVLSKDDKDKNHQLRLHATQLIRTIINIPGGVDELSQGTYRALVAVAEQTSDDIRHICIETLAELMVIEPSLVFEAGGVKVMLNAMNESMDDRKNVQEQSNSFALAVAMAFVGAADNPELRTKYLRNGRDLSALLTHFTDAPLYGFARPDKYQLQSSAIVMRTILRSWVGLTCFDMELFVKCMTIPIAETQTALLSVLDGILWIPDEPDSVSCKTSMRSAELLSLQFTGVLLNLLQRAGLQEKLVELQTDGATEAIRNKAQFLGSKIFSLSAKLVPQHDVVGRSMVIPQSLSAKLARASTSSLPTESIALFRSEAKLQQVNTWDSKPHLLTFIRFGVSIDDASFKRLINMTHVLDTKIVRQWNWDAILELVKGPLRSPKRVDELTRGSKFLKRIFNFYRPFKHRFSNLTITRDHMKYVEVGEELVLSLLETTEGTRYLSQNKLFRQIAECLAQLDPLSGIMSKDPLFSVRKFKHTLCGAYSELLCVLTRSEVGHKILSQIRVFNMFYRLCEINREDVVKAVICGMDYRLEGHPRIILAKTLKSSSRTTRIYATDFVGYKLAAEEPHLWAIDLMVEQLYDPDIVVANAAVAGLHNMCAVSSQALDYLISLKPYLGQLHDASEPLKTLLMSRPAGIELLMAELESRTLDQWVAENNVGYVDKIETYLESINFKNMARSAETSPEEMVQGLSPKPFSFPEYSRPSKKHTQDMKDAPPPHLYGELALTEQGCRLLKSKGILAELSKTIEEATQTLHEPWAAEKMLKVKGALWATGHIASRQRGGVLLDISVASNICKMCKEAQVLTLRGTAFYTLGLFALSYSGAELLHQKGWEIVYDAYCRPLGVALPPNSYFLPDSDALELRKNRLSRTRYPPGANEFINSPGLSSAKIDTSSQTLTSIETEAHESELVTPTEASTEKLSDAIPPLGTDASADASITPDVRSVRSVSPITRTGRGETVARSNVSVRSAQMLPRANSSKRIRTPSVGENDSGQSQALPLLAPSISFNSLLSPKTQSPSHSFDFEVDPELSSRRSSCFDLIETKQNTAADQVFKSISQLGSYVLAQKASRTLITLRATHPDLFQNGEVLLEVIQILSTGHYKQVTRRFVFELFDVQQCLEKLYRRRTRLGSVSSMFTR